MRSRGDICKKFSFLFMGFLSVLLVAEQSQAQQIAGLLSGNISSISCSGTGGSCTGSVTNGGTTDVIITYVFTVVDSTGGIVAGPIVSPPKVIPAGTTKGHTFSGPLSLPPGTYVGGCSILCNSHGTPIPVLDTAATDPFTVPDPGRNRDGGGGSQNGQGL